MRGEQAEAKGRGSSGTGRHNDTDSSWQALRTHVPRPMLRVGTHLPCKAGASGSTGEIQNLRLQAVQQLDLSHTALGRQSQEPSPACLCYPACE